MILEYVSMHVHCTGSDKNQCKNTYMSLAMHYAAHHDTIWVPIKTTCRICSINKSYSLCSWIDDLYQWRIGLPWNTYIPSQLHMRGEQSSKPMPQYVSKDGAKRSMQPPLHVNYSWLILRIIGGTLHDYRSRFALIFNSKTRPNESGITYVWWRVSWPPDSCIIDMWIRLPESANSLNKIDED